MPASEPQPLSRILIVDDNPSVHDAFDRILRAEKPDQELEREETLLFGDSQETVATTAESDIDHAMSGQEAIDKVRQSLTQERPYQVAFVDIRMPGMDGVKTIERIWEFDTKIQTVICTAYADYRWRDLAQRFGRTDRLLVLKKPFHDIDAALRCEQFAAHRLEGDGPFDMRVEREIHDTHRPRAQHPIDPVLADSRRHGFVRHCGLPVSFR